MSNWISVKEKLPYHTVKVLAYIDSDFGFCYQIVRAVYIPKFTVAVVDAEDGNYSGGDFNKKDQIHYLYQGWYEVNSFGLDDCHALNKIDREVSHWMVMPEKPSLKEIEKL